MLSIIDLNKENKEFDTPVEDYNIRPPSYGTAMKKGILQRFTRLGRMTGYLDSCFRTLFPFGRINWINGCY